MTGLLVILDSSAHLRVGVAQILLFLLCQIRIFQRGENVVEFRFEFFKLCTEHVDLLSYGDRGDVTMHTCIAIAIIFQLCRASCQQFFLSQAKDSVLLADLAESRNCPVQVMLLMRRG